MTTATELAAITAPDRKPLRHALPDVSAWLSENVTRLHSLTSEARLREVIADELGKVLRFRAALALVGSLRRDQIEIMDVVNCGYPDELAFRIKRGVNLSERPTAMQWLSERRPVFVPAFTISSPRSDEASDVLRYDLGCRAVHGAFDISGIMATYFSFCGLPDDAGLWIGPQLELLIPHLHCVLARLWHSKCRRQADRLSGRERSLIQLVSDGLTNPEIAREWNRSTATVRNTLHRLMNKLGVRSRVELVLSARDLQLL